MSHYRQPKSRLTLELLEGRLCLSAADLLPAVPVAPPVPQVERQAPTDQFSLNFAKVEFNVTDSRSGPAPAQVDYFLKLKGIDGEATDHATTGGLDVLSWNSGATNAGTHGGGGGTGKVSFRDLDIGAKMSQATDDLTARSDSDAGADSLIIHIPNGDNGAVDAGYDMQKNVKL